MSSGVEPIVAEGKLFAATHAGNVYALNGQTGDALWRFQAGQAFLHAPAFQKGLVVAACTDGGLYALDAATGKPRWSVFVGRGGFSASPTVADGAVFIGTRTGECLAVELKSGAIRWRQRFGVPVRQTGAFAAGRVFVTPDDLRVRCLDAKTGKVLWTSSPLIGQTARDYYPVIAPNGARTRVIIRTNPVTNMAQLNREDQSFLCRHAGIDDSDWRKVDAWTKSDAAIGDRQRWAEEQRAIVRYLSERPAAQTFFLLEAETGKKAGTAPVLWVGGCQGVGTPPVVMPDGRLFVFYRTAFGNWNHGVAPLVGLGFLNAENFIHPVLHTHGMQPPWNSFWGTADESQNFVVAGDTVLIVHQGTLSGFDLKTRQLFTLAGDRDSWGGFRNLPWARNEWHGPARGGVAVVGRRIYWQTGSRILCLAAGRQEKAAEDTPIHAAKIAATTSQRPPVQTTNQPLADAVTELLSHRWAPLILEPGIGGQEVFFDDSAEVFEALAWAYPYLSGAQQRRVKEFLANEWQQHPPFAKAAWYALNEGERRQRFWTPPDGFSRLGIHHPSHHPFGNLYAVSLYAQRCGDWERVRSSWQRIRACFEDFRATDWRLNPAHGDLLANRYIASLRAFAQLAEKEGDVKVAEQAKSALEQNAGALLAWWKRSAERMTLPVIPNITAWDEFINRGDALFFSIRPHRAKLALFHDLTPEVAAIVKSHAPDAVEKLWNAFERLCPTWHLVGEERQVHYGENFIDPPDFALAAFKALAWLRDPKASALRNRVDIPFCRADLSYIVKLSLVQESLTQSRRAKARRAHRSWAATPFQP